MKTRTTASVVSMMMAATLASCMDRRPASVCPVPTELKKDVFQTGDYDGVDLLVMVDNSGSMGEEQQILATGFFTLINSLANPVSTWRYEAVDSMRLAVVSSNMGLSFGEGVEVSDDAPSIGKCEDPRGDDGAFMAYPSIDSVPVFEGVITCDADGAQCPNGWSCGDVGDGGVGVCSSTSGDTAVACPSFAQSWVESDDSDPNPAFNIQAACLAQQGTEGCGFEQQLQSVAVALDRDDQKAFLVKTHLLAVLVVTDEEDCSIEDEGLFGVEEMGSIDGAQAANIACGENPDYLMTLDYFHDVFTGAKQNENAVIFAAIIGVPPGEGDELGPCQGSGDEIDDCLDDDHMQLDPIILDDTEGKRWAYTPACERYEEGIAKAITSAVPGRRYVELATDHFGANSYVYSICNPDWSPAMESVAGLIAAQIGGTCYDRPLDWNAVDKVAKCNVVAEFMNSDECPWELSDGAEAQVVTTTNDDGDEVKSISCPLPKLESEQYCRENDAAPTDFGWFYCINDTNEDNEAACMDNIDNDADGLTDCADDECGPCMKACAGSGNGCRGACKYNVSITDQAKSMLTGVNVTVQCLQQFSFEDGNCQEDTVEACTDGQDNDGNGVYDCSNVDEGGDAHLADPHCCPMVAGDDGTCALEDADGDGEPDYRAICGVSDYPDSCVKAAEELSCLLPVLPL